jgi:hypothetical protein
MDEIVAGWRRGFRAIDRRAMKEWARTLNLQGDYARTGPFRSSRHLEAPLDAMSDDRVRMVNLRKATQTFGSGIGDIFLHHTMENNPGPFMVTFQSDDDASDHYETRLRPTMEANPFGRQQLATLHRRRSLFKFAAMNVYIQGANWNSLQRKSVRFAWNSEIWRWQRGFLQEAFARTNAYRSRSKTLNESQAGLEGDDEDLNWSNGCQHEAAWKCPRCQRAQLQVFFAARRDPQGNEIKGTGGKPIRAGIVWNADARRKDGRWDIARAAESARLLCIYCGADFPDVPQTWRLVEDSLHYICTTPDVPIRNSSFRWTSLVSGDYRAMVDEFLKASEAKAAGSIEPLKKFYQKKLVIPWDESMSETPAILRTGQFLMGERLPDATHTFIVGDYQEGRANDSEHYWVVVRDWRGADQRTGAPATTRLVWCGRVENADEIRALQLKLEVKDKCVILDGGDRLLYIAGICARFGWTIFVGDDRETFPHTVKGRKKPILRAWAPRKRIDPGRGTKLQGRSFAWCFYWSNPSIKNITWRNRHGYGIKWELPADLPQFYRDQIDSEAKVRVIDRASGQISYLWKRLHPKNHIWDDENMQTGAALIAGIIAFDVDDNSKPDATAKKLKPADDATPIAPHDQPEQLTLLRTE